MKIQLLRILFKVGLEEASQQRKNALNDGHVPTSEQLESTEGITDHPAAFLPVANAADLLPSGIYYFSGETSLSIVLTSLAFFKPVPRKLGPSSPEQSCFLTFRGNVTYDLLDSYGGPNEIKV